MSAGPARFGHVNLIAADWRRLARFYTEVFGCTPVPPERNLSGEALVRGTGLPDAALSGIHLRLPGQGDNGPTLEIFSYVLNDVIGPAMPNRTGFGISRSSCRISRLHAPPCLPRVGANTARSSRHVPANAP